MNETGLGADIGVDPDPECDVWLECRGLWEQFVVGVQDERRRGD